MMKKYLSEIKPFGKWTKNITHIDKLVKSVDEELTAEKTANILLLGNPQAIDWVQILKVEI